MNPKELGLILSFILVTGMLPPPANAQMGDSLLGIRQVEEPAVNQAGVAEMDQLLSQILQAQGVSQIDQLDCTQVSQADLERLGDAWMEAMHPGEAHQRMDEMLGGEGSATRKAMHIRMGEHYLGCNGFREGRGWMPHMGMMPWVGMMGSGWTAGSGSAGGGMQLFWISWVVTVILVDALLVALIRYFWKKVK